MLCVEIANGSDHVLSYCFKQQNIGVVCTGTLQKIDAIFMKKSGLKGSQTQCLVVLSLLVNLIARFDFFFLCKLT